MVSGTLGYKRTYCVINNMEVSMNHRISNWIGFTLFLVFIGFLIVRVRMGIDLSDESYYAIFLKDWLTGGIKQSYLLTIHQTAALVIYPFAFLYYKLVGSTDGLFLFLRYIFLFGSVLAAISWIVFFKKAKFPALISWVSGLIILVFIPFGLPAPSYNTLGCQLLTIALATFGCAALDKPSSSIKTLWMFLSACAFTLAMIAYPALVVSFGFFVLLLLLLRDSILKDYLSYLILLGMTSLLGLLLVCHVLSFDRIYQSVVYLSAINNPASFSTKINFILTLLKQNTIFTILLIVSLIVGISRNYLNESFKIITMTVILLTLLFITPVFYQHSHDVIALSALMGLSLMIGLILKQDYPDRIFSFIFTVSFISALVICLTATHSVFNFCIGAVPAALLAISGKPASKHIWLTLILMCSVVTGILSTSFFIFYGEVPNNVPHERRYISQGFFAGLVAQVEDVELMALVEKELLPVLTQHSSIAIFGRIPGLNLILPSKVMMLTSFPLMPTASKKGLDMTHDFYAQVKNRPDFVLIYEDVYFTPVNPMQPDFNRWYVLFKTVKTAQGKLSLYKRRM